MRASLLPTSAAHSLNSKVCCLSTTDSAVEGGGAAEERPGQSKKMSATFLILFDWPKRVMEGGVKRNENVPMHDCFL